MAYYSGKVQRNMLVDKIVQLLTTAPVGSSEAYWKKVNSGTFQGDGYILKSSGKSGSNDIFIRFSNTTLTNAILVSVLEGYVPNVTQGIDGVITNESSKATLYFHNVTYDGSFPVEYFLSFDRDKVILALRGDKSVDGKTFTSLLWAGMPDRLDTKGDTGSGAVSIAASRGAIAITGGTSSYTQLSRCRALRDRGQELNALTNMVTLGNVIGRSKGWGDNIMLPKIYLEDSTGVEGIRSIMDGVSPIYHDPVQAEFKDGDEIIQNSKRYTVLCVAYDGVSGYDHPNNCFPSTWMAMEQLL